MLLPSRSLQLFSFGVSSCTYAFCSNLVKSELLTFLPFSHGTWDNELICSLKLPLTTTASCTEKHQPEEWTFLSLGLRTQWRCIQLASYWDDQHCSMGLLHWINLSQLLWNLNTHLPSHSERTDPCFWGHERSCGKDLDDH